MLRVESDETERVEISVIGRHIVVTGDIETAVDLHVDGRVMGNIRCGTLFLGEGSCVTGNISAERVRVSGVVKGSIETGDLAVEASAEVKGNVTYTRIRISNGGIIDGKFKYRRAPSGGVGAARERQIRAPRVKVIAVSGEPAE